MMNGFTNLDRYSVVVDRPFTRTGQYRPLRLAHGVAATFSVTTGYSNQGKVPVASVSATNSKGEVVDITLTKELVERMYKAFQD